MKKIYMLALMLAIITLTGCVKTEAPKCSDSEVESTLKKIYTQQMEKTSANMLAQVLLASVPKTISEINSARPISYDENINLRSCKAEATLGKDITSTIEYTVQLDEKNNGQFYVELQMDFIEDLAQQGMMNQFMKKNK